nr:LysR family transcriptional regulator [Rhizobium leguminosarum]
MDFFRLRTLRELSRRETMAAVADATGISSSAVSQQIAQLEDEGLESRSSSGAGEG